MDTISYSRENLRLLLTTGYLGLLATLMVGTGEFMVHYSAEGYDYADVPFSFFHYVSESNFMLSQFLLVFGIPCYFVGYWHVYMALSPGNKKLAVITMMLGIFSFTVGGIWVGSRTFIGSIFHYFDSINDLDTYAIIATKYEAYIEVLVQLLRVLVLLVSGFFIAAIVKGGTLYPKWMAAFNPIIILLIVFALFFVVPVIGNYMIPTAMNIAHFVMFSFSIYSIKNQINNGKISVE